MAWSEPSHIDICQGNATLRELMVTLLESAGHTVHARTAGEVEDEAVSGAAGLGDLLIVDVDSGLEGVDELLTTYRSAVRPVLVCGLRASREHYPTAHWLARPFSGEQFLDLCRQILHESAMRAPGASGRARVDEAANEEASRHEQLLGAREVEELLSADQGRLRALLEAPTNPANAVSGPGLHDLAEDTEDTSSEPQNHPQMEQAPDSPAPATPDAHLAGDTDGFETLDAEELFDAAPVAPGGELRGAIVRRRLVSEELQAQLGVASLQDVPAPPAPRPGTQSLTLPEVPAVKLVDEFVSDGADENSRPNPAMTHVTPVGQPTTHTSGLYPPVALQPAIAAAAELLSHAWGNIGRLARAKDRAAHIRKVLSATLAGGHSAGASEVQRIPSAPGFSGDLAALGVLGLLETIRDRGLRGRLEVSVGAQDFVLYVQGATLDWIENLAGNDDRLLLDILLQMGCLAAEQYRALEHSLRDEFAPPLQMQLRGQHFGANDGSHPGGQPARMVSADNLREARRQRAFRLLTELTAAGARERADGSFAFIQVVAGGAHAWPVDALGLALQELIQAVRREDSRLNERPSWDTFQQNSGAPRDK